MQINKAGIFEHLTNAKKKLPYLRHMSGRTKLPRNVFDDTSNNSNCTVYAPVIWARIPVKVQGVDRRLLCVHRTGGGGLLGTSMDNTQ